MTARRTAVRPTSARLAAVVAVALVLALSAAPAARAELELTLFLGHAEIPGSDLRLTLPGGTDLRFADVSWDDESFDDPPYYAARLARWLPRSPAWGIALDFTHAKAILDVDEPVPARGLRRGVPFDGALPVDDQLAGFEMSHGLDTLTLGGVRRWGAARTGSGRVTYFAGLGAGVAVPHVEARAAGLRTAEYQLAGPALQAVLGLDTAVDENIGITLEARASWVDVEADLAGGGRVETDLWLLQLVAGLSLRD